MAGDALVRHVVTFGRVLREAGLRGRAGPRRRRAARRSTPSTSTRQDDVYWALRQTLVSRRDELELFDRAFQAWFLRAPLAPPRAARAAGARAGAARPARPPRAARRRAGRRGRRRAGRRARLRARTSCCARRTSPTMTPEELAPLRRADRRASPPRARAARSRRLRRDRRGDRLDLRRARPRARSRTGGDPIERAVPRAQARAAQARRALRRLGLDGGVRAGAAPLPARGRRLRAAASRRSPSARGSRASRPSSRRATPSAALDDAHARRVVDWVGRHADRRLAEAVQRRLGQAGAHARRGRRDRLRRLGARRSRPRRHARWRGSHAPAYAVVWVNPLKGNPDYQPLAGGMRAALPYVDRFLAGHNLASLEELAVVLAGIERRHAA